jgi:hypothetical protein
LVSKLDGTVDARVLLGQRVCDRGGCGQRLIDIQHIDTRPVVHLHALLCCPTHGIVRHAGFTLPEKRELVTD